MTRDKMKKNFIKKFGEKEGIERFEKYIVLGMKFLKEKLILRYGDIEGNKRYNLHIEKMKKRGTKQYYIDKFGEQEGIKKYLEKNSKLSVSEKALRKNGKTEEEIQQIKQKHKKNSVIDEQKYINKYGEKEGKARYKDLCIRKGENGIWSINYWLKKCDNNLELAKQALHDCQIRDLNFFIKLYGEIEGQSRYQQYVKKITKNWVCNKTNSKGQLELEGFIRNNYNCNICKVYGYKERWTIFLNKQEINQLGQKTIYPDIFIKNIINQKKIIIEYFGDFWHCDELLFKDKDEMYKFYKNKTIKQIRNCDILKKQFIEKRDYKYLVIWEHDWEKNREQMEKIVREAIYEIEK